MEGRLFMAAFCFLLIAPQMGHPYKQELHYLRQGNEQHQRAALVEERGHIYTCRDYGGRCKLKSCGIRPHIPKGTCAGNGTCCWFQKS
uniref:Defensin n=1 Tax=Rhipicephalus zambeziensis TaxID=60191 RepID=A0A224YCM6_9ACAR